ncbi:2-hydroxyacid dehydrogenase [Pseudalkalibacillus caeni]|uniref:D-glycerate dehydrogenase n=1 Tax=Exobacillus caeni TaxID=2574798 RepID=A0A5R9FH10_9BACL|nr:D-glycerate dehydrogenase [Pseudalkalibacillus caeni]TLS38835.1 D-glycerate dehydrogenase [Pseudalkalibacillus caeni]
MKPNLFITRKLPEKVLQPLKDIAVIEMWPKEEEPVPNELLEEKVKTCDGILTMLTDTIDEKMLNDASKLKVIANMAVGYDNIDISAAKHKNIIVTNTPDVLTNSTADLTFGLLMAVSRRMLEASDMLREGKWNNWSPFQMAGTDIYGKTIGIVGMGRIGKAVAKRATGFDMKILYHNRSRNQDAENKLDASYCSFDELLERSDFVVCLTPLTEQTKDMFNKTAFKKMKPSAFFINTSRGGVVDERALKEALDQGEIAGAGLDVYKNEPIGKEHPLLRSSRVVALPHIGSASYETRMKMAELARDNIIKVINGQSPITPV